MRIPGFYKLDFYMIRKSLGMFFFMIILLMFILVIFDLSEILDEFIGNQAPPKAIILDYFLKLIPYGCIIGLLYCLFLYCMFFKQNSTITKGIISLINTKWEINLSPIGQNSTSFIAKNLPKAYLRHLIVSKEVLVALIASTLNLSFYLKLAETVRNKINEETFSTWRNLMVVNLANRLLLTRKT